MLCAGAGAGAGAVISMPVVADMSHSCAALLFEHISYVFGACQDLFILSEGLAAYMLS